MPWRCGHIGRPIRASSPRCGSTTPTMTADAGPCGLWPDDLGPTYDREHNENVQYWNFGCASPAQSRRHGREQGRPGAAARRSAALYRAPHHRARQVPPRRSHRDRRIPTRTKARSATWANDDATRCKPHRLTHGRATSTSRRRRAYRCRPFARPSRPPPPSRRPARIAACRKAHLKIQMGGITAAVEAYSSSPTPNVIMIESESRGDDVLGGLDSLAEVCDAGTRVVVIGRHNDVAALSRADAPRRQRLPDRAGRHARRGALDLRAVLRARRQAGRARHRGHRRQGRRRRLDRRPQHRLGGGARPPARHRRRRSRSRASEPPASTTIRTRRRASPTRCSRPTASTPPSSTACCRNARTI